MLKPILHQLHQHKNPIKKRLLIGLGIISALSILYHTIYARRIIPGVYIGKVAVGGMDYDSAKKKLQDFVKSQNKTLNLKYSKGSYEITADDIYLSYSYDGVLTRAFEVGRSGDFFIDNKDKIAGIFKPLTIRAFYDLDDTALNNKVLTIKGEINIPEEDSWYTLNGKDLIVTKSSKGQVVDSETLNKLISSRLDNIDFTDIQIPIENKNPKVTEVDAEKLKDSAKQIIYNPITVTNGTKKWPLTPAQMLSLVQIKRTDTGETELDVNKNELDMLSDTLAQEVNIMPKGKVTADETGKVTSFELTQAGTAIDKKAFAQDFKRVLGKQTAIVTIPTVPVKDSDKNKYGIYSLLGEGSSKYAGSIPSRIKNLNLAASRTNGVLVAPGTVYSFNKTIGEISGATGYDAAYIISNGRTVLGEGGGVCQTSTTLFRAVLKAGLPVVTRFPHAYRVHYYEEDTPPGIDASVFQPSLDFQFKNDTPNYILLEAIPDIPNLSLKFRIYGTPDGRTVEMTEPVLSNVTAAPPAVYQDDPTLPKGVIRQVDWSAPGTTAQFSRTVTRDGQVLFKDTFTSRYQAWRAVFLRGTKE